MAMDLNAKAAYIRGLMTGMDFDADSKNGKVIAANMWGKVKTVLQMLSIIFYFFGTALSYRGTVDSVSIVVVVSIALCWLVAAVTAISGIKYLWDNRSFINTAK